jgi:hypothetical protein
VNAATRDYLTQLQNPYAKLSFIDDADDLIWKHKSEIYDFIANRFSCAQLRTRPPAALKELADMIVHMSLPTQRTLHRRILSRTADVQFAHNRLAPNELERLLADLRAMVDDVRALDASQEE